MPHDEANKIAGAEVLVFRQVHPSWIVADRVSSQAFRPTPKDQGCLSVANSTKTEAKAFFDRYILKLKSVGVWAVTIKETESAGLAAFDAPTDDEPAHGCVNFEGLSNNVAKQKADILVAAARARGPVHLPEPTPAA